PFEDVAKVEPRLAGEMPREILHPLGENADCEAAAVLDVAKHLRAFRDRDGDQWRIERDRHEGVGRHAMVAALAMRRDDGDTCAELATGIAQLARIDRGHWLAALGWARPERLAGGAVAMSRQFSSVAAAAARPDRRKPRIRLLETISPLPQHTGGRMRVLKCCRNSRAVPPLQDPKRKSSPTTTSRGCSR